MRIVGMRQTLCNVLFIILFCLLIPTSVTVGTYFRSPLRQDYVLSYYLIKYFKIQKHRMATDQTNQQTYQSIYRCYSLYTENFVLVFRVIRLGQLIIKRCCLKIVPIEQIRQFYLLFLNIDKLLSPVASVATLSNYILPIINREHRPTRTKENRDLAKELQHSKQISETWQHTGKLNSILKRAFASNNPVTAT